ncbi:MAG: S8 family peptidase [Parvibaculales bacterium]
MGYAREFPKHLCAYDLCLRALLLGGLVPLMVALAACGGGSGGDGNGGGNTKPPNTTATPPSVLMATPKPPAPGWQSDAAQWAEHRGYRQQFGLAMINASAAYAAGATGTGVTIGFVDTGLAENHAAFDGKQIMVNDRTGLRDGATPRQLSHGTAVASIALAGRHDRAQMHGVAFNAVPAMYSLHLSPQGFLHIDDAALATAIGKLEAAGAKIINHSWGYDTVLDASLADTQRAFLSNEYGSLLARQRQGKAIHVWAAGNNAAPQITVSSAWPVLFPDLAGLGIAVAGLGDDGDLGLVSNACGVAAAHCLAAPGDTRLGSGVYNWAANAGGAYRPVYGTSYAAPFVSGVLALMMEAFGEQLSLKEYTGRLLATADKSGIYANSAKFGQGLVDAAAALTPVSPASIPLPKGGLARPADSYLGAGILPRDMYDRLMKEKIIILDALGSPFQKPLGRPLPTSPASFLPQLTSAVGKPRPPLYRNRRFGWDMAVWDAFALSNMDGSALAFLMGRQISAHPFLSGMTRQGLALSGGVMKRTGRGIDYRVTSFAGHKANTAYQFAGVVGRRKKGVLSMEIGSLNEDNGLLTATGSGGLPLGRAQTFFVGMGLNSGDRLADGELAMTVQLGHTQMRGAKNSLLGDFRGIGSGLSAQAKLGQLTFNLTSPLTFETGQWQLRLPKKRVPGQGVLFSARDLPLSSASRPLQLGMRYGGERLVWAVQAETVNGEMAHIGAKLRRVF